MSGIQKRLFNKAAAEVKAGGVASRLRRDYWRTENKPRGEARLGAPGEGRV